MIPTALEPTWKPAEKQQARIHTRPRGQHARGLSGYVLFGLRNESIEAFAGMRTADWDLDFPEGCVQLSSPVYVDCRPSSNGKVIFRSFHASFSDSSPGIQPTFGVKIFIYGVPVTDEAMLVLQFGTPVAGE